MIFRPNFRYLRSCRYFLLILLAGMGTSAADQTADIMPDSEVKKEIIEESMEAYAGSCPCPYSRTKKGALCGKRSAWSKAGGESPICYAEEVTAQMVQQWRERHG